MNKTELRNLNKLLAEGFSLITADENKIPNIAWKKYQTEQISKDDLEIAYNKPNTDIVGLCTGYNDVECMDIDLKVFGTAKEKIDFWNDYISLLESNIMDFKDKFVICKTKNEGFHILYKTKRVEGNQKVAKLKGHKECVIETRGQGGYVALYYGREVGEKTYLDIDYITDLDRDILFQCSKVYNYEEPKPEVKYVEAKKVQSSNNGLGTAEDYNNRTQVWDLISDEFSVLRNNTDRIIIKRHGATSSLSGSIYKDNDLLYLFTTGTVYPHEKALDAFSVYTWKNHNGDYKDSLRELYKLGYGDRFKPEPVEIPIDEPLTLEDDKLKFPLEVFPEELIKYILRCEKTLSSSRDFMGCSLLYATSLIVGKAMSIKVKNGWVEQSNLWISLVGRAGVGKTPSINNILRPIKKINTKEIKQYMRDSERYDVYQELSASDKRLAEEVYKPVKTQFIVNDITIEALVELHEQNKNGVGVVKDELAGWIKDMNKYREGSDLQQWLSSWSGEDISLNRKTAKSSFVQGAFIPVMGGIQPEILVGFSTDENKANGFLDRMLFSFPDLSVEDYNDNEMSQDVLDYFDNFISSFYSSIRNGIEYDNNQEIVTKTLRMDSEAKAEWIRVFTKITELQNSENIPEYLKSMLPKQKSYVARFALLLHVLHEYANGGNNFHSIGVESIERAAKLFSYFYEMAKKIKLDSAETSEIRAAVSDNKSKNKFDSFKAMYKSNPNISKTKAADNLGVSRTTINNYIKKLTNEA